MLLWSFYRAGLLARKLQLSRSATYSAINTLENLAIYQRQAVRDIVEEQIERSVRLQRRRTTGGRDWR